MEVIQSPNEFISNDYLDKIYIFLGGKIKNELIDYLKKNISQYSIKNIDKIILFNPIQDFENKSEDEIKKHLKWEDEYIKKSDIFIILIDETETPNDKYFNDLGKYLSYFYDVYKKNINQHCIIAFTKEFTNKSYLKNELSITFKDLIPPIEIEGIDYFGNLILKKLEELFIATNTSIEHNIVHTEQEHYWSINLGPKIKKLFCQSPWPKSNFSIGITGLFNIGKTHIYNWFREGRFKRFYEHYIGGYDSKYQVEINNQNFIVHFEDTGGQDKFKNYNIKKLRKKNCVIFVFDITNRQSFKEIENVIYPHFQSLENNGDNFINVLVGNKLDVKFERTVTYEEGDIFADENNMKYFEVSAKSGENMERLCNYIYDKFSKH